MLQRLAYVVREHRAMTEAMGDMGSPGPGPGADVMAIINNRQAQVGAILLFGRHQPVECVGKPLGRCIAGCLSYELHSFLGRRQGLLHWPLDSISVPQMSISHHTSLEC